MPPEVIYSAANQHSTAAPLLVDCRSRDTTASPCTYPPARAYHPIAAKLDELQEAESEAVQQEDFEQAALLGSELDAARVQLGELQSRLKVRLSLRLASI